MLPQDSRYNYNDYIDLRGRIIKYIRDYINQIGVTSHLRHLDIGSSRVVPKDRQLYHHLWVTSHLHDSSKNIRLQSIE